MRSVRVFRVSVAAGPNFVEEEGPQGVNGPVQIEAQAAVFFTGRPDQRAQLRLEKRFLTFARTQQNNQRDSVLGKLCVPARRRSS